MEQYAPNFFFFSKKNLDDFHYGTYKFGGLRFFLELAIFLGSKSVTNNPKSCIIFFRMCRDYLVKIDAIKSCDGYKYSSAAMINLLLFVNICRFEKREKAIQFLEKHKEWAIALGFYDGVPNESDITKFINKIGTGLDTCFILLLKFIHENVSIDGITEIQIIGFLQHSDRVGIRIRTGKQFTGYSQKKSMPVPIGQA